MSVLKPLIFIVGLRREAQILGVAGAQVMLGADAAEVETEDAAGILSFGLCGALSPGLAAGDLLVGSDVVDGEETFLCDERWRERLLSVAGRPARFAASAEVVALAQSKALLRERTGADAVDMESGRAARIAQARRLPLAVVRAVSDIADQDLARSVVAGFRTDGRVDVWAVMRSLASAPLELGDLLRAARNAEAGFRSLKAAAPRMIAIRP